VFGANAWESSSFRQTVRFGFEKCGEPRNILFQSTENQEGTVLEPGAPEWRRGLHCTVDTSPPLGMTNANRVHEVSEYFFVADHHAAREDVEANCRKRGVKRVQLGFVGLPVGSTSASKVIWPQWQCPSIFIRFVP